MVLNEKHKELMRRVFGTDNLRAIYDDDNNAAGDYAVNMLISYICETKGIQGDSDLAEDIIDALYELDERESKGET